jgi:D-alanine-D-alanine ligase-like ATP-grasp enzyme
MGCIVSSALAPDLTPPSRTPNDWQALYSSLKKIPRRCINPYTNLYAEGASRLGWDVEIMSRSKSVILCHPKGRGPSSCPVLVRRHKVDVLCNNQVAKIFKSKFETQKQLMQIGVPCPQTFYVHASDGIPILRLKPGQGGPYVVKPVQGSQGKGVHMGLQNKKEVLEALKDIWSSRKVPCLVQEQVEGSDYRILLLRGKLLEVIQRIPAYVTGDGVSSTEELIEHDNKRRKACDLPLLVKVPSLGPFNDVPPAGTRRTIQDKANVSLGGEPLRYPLDRIHRTNISLFMKMAEQFKEQPMLGIDFLGDLAVPWRRRPPKQGASTRPRYSGVILELNSSPQMFCHTLRRNTFNLGIIQKILMEASIEARIKQVSIENRKSSSKRRKSSRRRIGSGSKSSGMGSSNSVSTKNTTATTTFDISNASRPKSRSGGSGNISRPKSRSSSGSLL